MHLCLHKPQSRSLPRHHLLLACLAGRSLRYGNVNVAKDKPIVRGIKRRYNLMSCSNYVVSQPYLGLAKTWLPKMPELVAKQLT